MMNVLASLKLTLVGMALLGAGALLVRNGQWSSSWWVTIPIALLTVNLLAAIAMNRRFRRQPTLLAFHICLLLIVLLAALGRTTRLEGRMEIAEGQPFDPASIEIVAQGPWHQWGLDEAAFEQGAISVEYSPGVVRGRTQSQIIVPSEQGDRRVVTVGDDRPLVVDGYRFYTSPNKGWAVRMSWSDNEDDVQRGDLHLPSFPFMIRRQSNRWQLPTGEEAELSLEPMEVPMTESWVLESGEHQADATVVLRIGDRVVRMTPGAVVELPGGRLQYETTVMWMGYRISYDETRPWIAAAATAAVGLMSWHFWQTLWSTSSSRIVAKRSAAGARA
jgi:cytochrome c biogenesis protein